MALKNSFNSLDSFPAGDMGQPGWANHISCRINSFYACLVTIVHLNKALLIKLDLNALRQERRNSDGHQDAVTFNGFGLFAFNQYPYPFIAGFRFDNFSVR